MREIRRQIRNTRLFYLTLAGVWKNLPFVERLAWIYLFSTTVSVVTLMELLLLK